MNGTTEAEKKLDSMDRTLQEILKWTRFANISKLKETLETELDTDEKRLAYENSDGTRGIEEVATVSGTPRDTVYSWWQKWFRLGIVVDSEARKGRIARIVSLDDLGIKIPKKGISHPTPSAAETPQVEPSPPAETEKKIV
jgi:hypothetical protein